MKKKTACGSIDFANFSFIHSSFLFKIHLRFAIYTVHIFLRDDKIRAIGLQQNVSLSCLGYGNWMGTGFVVYAHYSDLRYLPVCYYSWNHLGSKRNF